MAVLLAVALPMGGVSAEDDTGVPRAGEEPPKKPPAEPGNPVSPAVQVCCDDGVMREIVSSGACKSRMGKESPIEECKPVCCKQGRANWWMGNRQACFEDGGIVADQSYCR